MKSALRYLLIISIILSAFTFTDVSAFAVEGDSPATAETQSGESAPSAAEEVIGEAEEPEVTPALAVTTVKGVPKSINAYAKSTVKRTLEISPSKPERTVRLQLYKSEKGKFVTVKRYTTKRKKTAKLEIEFPSKYRKKTTGVWRIVVDGSDTAQKYVSREFTLTTRNVEKADFSAESACVYCLDTGKVIYGRKMKVRRSMASTTKVMTALVVLESGKADGKVKISKSASLTPYRNLFMKKGDKYNNRDLLYALLLASSNDAAVALSEGVSGSTADFVKAMNSKAEELGLKDTHYANPHGLTANGHYTTAKDLARLMGYAYSNGEFMDIITTPEYSFTSLKKKEKRTVKTTDKLKGYKNHICAKTGYTKKAGMCYVTLYKYKGRTYAVSLLNCKGKEARTKDAKKLYKYIRRNAQSGY